MKTLITLLTLFLSCAVYAQVQKDTMFHIFDKNNKYIDHSKDKDSLKQRNYLIPGELYFIEKFYGPENEKKTKRCKLKINDEADTESIK